MRRTTGTGSRTTRIGVVTGIAGVLLAGSLAGSAAAFGGHGGGRMGHMGGEQIVERMAERLDLSQEQITAIRNIMDETREERRALRDGMRETRRAIADSMQGVTLDEDAFRLLAEAQGDAIADMIVLRASVRTQMNAVLTDEQRERFDKLRSERRGRRR